MLIVGIEYLKTLQTIFTIILLFKSVLKKALLKKKLRKIIPNESFLPVSHLQCDMTFSQLDSFDSFWLSQFLRLALFLMNSTVLLVRCFVEWSLYWVLFDGFLMTRLWGLGRLRLWGFGKNTIEAKYHCYHIILRIRCVCVCLSCPVTSGSLRSHGL